MPSKKTEKNPSVQDPARQLKCKRGSFCTRLEERLEEDNSRLKGISVLRTTDTTGVERLYGVAYRTDSKDRGMMFNYCPFCGVRILWDLKPVVLPTRPL